MSKLMPKWKVRLVVLSKKITLAGMVETASLYLVFIGVSHFSQSVAFVVLGVFGIWLTESEHR